MPISWLLGNVTIGKRPPGQNTTPRWTMSKAFLTGSKYCMALWAMNRARFFRFVDDLILTMKIFFCDLSPRILNYGGLTSKSEAAQELAPDSNDVSSSLYKVLVTGEDHRFW